MPSSPPGYLTINEAALQLGLTPWRVAEMARDGELPSVTFINADAVRPSLQAVPTEDAS